MAVRHVLVRRRPDQVWSVLADGDSYAAWVVGTSDSTGSPDWPGVGATIRYRIQVGAWRYDGYTVVRRSRPPQVLELEVYSGRLGTARVAIDVRSWGEDALITVDEHPLRGLGGRWHNALLDAVLQLRHRAMMERLASHVERTTTPLRPGAEQAPADP